jgi:hypothetical protein
MHFQSGGDSHERIYGNVFLPTLDVANVITVQIRFLSQFFLTPFQIPAVIADVIAQNLSVFWNLRHPAKEPETAYANYSICTVFCSCVSLALPRLSFEMNAKDIFVRRLGPDPHENGARSLGCYGCPDIWELDNGDFAVIGADITNAAGSLPPSARCGPDERMVRIPRKTLVQAKADIPDRL